MKIGLKTLALATMMAVGGGKAAAQNATHIAESAKTVVVEDTAKAVKNGVRDARTVLLKRYNGSFKGKVTEGGVVGDLTYNERGKVVPASVLDQGKKGVDIAIGADYVYGNDLVNHNGFGLTGTAEYATNRFGVSGLVSHKDPRTDFVADINYTKLFPVNSNFAFTAKAEAEGVIHRESGNTVKGAKKRIDNFGVLYPQVKGGAEYKQDLGHNVSMTVKGEGGVAATIVRKEDTPHGLKGVGFVGGGEVAFRSGNFTAFVGGGKDAVYGGNLQTGVRVNLK